MGHFFNPPPAPIVAATAAQPYAGGKLTPPGIPVNNPPFQYQGRSPQLVHENAAIAQPDPWPYVFLDKTTGAQPYGPPTNFPQGAVVVVTQVPFSNQWMASVIQSWFTLDSAPILPRYLNPTITAVRVDNPPFSQRAFIPPYPADYAVPQQSRFVPQTNVVAQGPYSNIWLANVIQSWFIPDPPVQLPRYLNPTVTAVRVDNPPFARQLFTQPYPSPTIFISGLVGIPQGAAAAAQVPYTQGWYSTVLEAWQANDPQPTLPRNLTPPGIPVNNPPFNQRTFFPPYPDAYVAPQSPVYLPQGAPVVVSAQGPYNNYWLATVLEAWQPVDPPPTLPRLSAGIPGWSVDNPPVAEGSLIITWLTPDPQPTLPRHLPATLVGVPVNNPPFSNAGRSAWVADLIVRAYQPPDPLPTLSGKLPPTLLAVAVNNPPFSSRSELANILAQWQFPPPQPTPSVPPPQVQPGPPPPPVTSQFTVSGPDVSVYLQEFFYDVVYTDAAITKRTV